MNKLSIILPVYNEVNLINTTLNRILNVKFPDYICEYEIIIIDDKSTDGTYEKINEFVHKSPIIQVFQLTRNMGKGAAVKYGIGKSSGDVIIIQDADLELLPDDIPTLLNAMYLLNIGFVNGSRYMPGIIRPIHSYKRYLANKFFSFLTSIFVDVRITDMACGYKLFTRELYDSVTINSNRFGFEAELIIKALRKKRNNVTEVPVNYFPRSEGEGKKIRNKDFFKILFTILKYGLFKK